jgi:oligoribonuclease NrnB/cAMP/cGMP phosphodiesterase (DHH superfamily)
MNTYTPYSAKAVVVYHDKCVDGFAAMLCFFLKFGEHVQYLPAQYGRPYPDPSELVGRTLYLVDFSFPPKYQESLNENNVTTILIDHHEAPLESVKRLVTDSKHSSVNNSGAVLAWKYINGNKPAPAVLRYVEDRDLWKFELPHSHKVNAFLQNRPKTVKDWQYLFSFTASELIDHTYLAGSELLAMTKGIQEQIIESALRGTVIGSFTVPVVNAPPQFASDIGNIISKDHPFGATYYDTVHGRVFSLRSHPEGLDVAKIAQEYGGNGHKHASGFRVDRDHPLAKF